MNSMGGRSDNLENKLFACHPVAHKIKRQYIQAAVATCSRIDPPQPARLDVYLLDHGVSNVAFPLRGLRHLPLVSAHVAAYFLNAVVEVPVDKRLGGGVIAVQRHNALHVVEQGRAGDFDFAVPEKLLQKIAVRRGGRGGPSVCAADFHDEGQVGRDEHIGVLGVVALLNEREFLAPTLLVHDPAQLPVHDQSVTIFHSGKGSSPYMTGRAMDKMMESMLLTEGMQACLKA